MFLPRFGSVHCSLCDKNSFVTMEKKNLHIVASEAAKQRIVRLINRMKTDEIVVCPTNLSYGILPKNNTRKELVNAAISLDKYDNVDRLYDFSHKDYSADEKVIVWHGRDAGSLLLQYWVATLTKDNLYEVDVADCEILFQKFLRNSVFHFNVIIIDGIMQEDLDCFDWMGKYMKKVTHDQHEVYKKQWNYWINTPSLLRVCRENDGMIDYVDKSLVEKKIVEIKGYDWFYKISDIFKYGVMLGIIECDLHKEFDNYLICQRIADTIMSSSVYLNGTGYKEMYDMIIWENAYSLENLREKNRLVAMKKYLDKKIK